MVCERWLLLQLLFHPRNLETSEEISYAPKQKPYKGLAVVWECANGRSTI